MSDPLADPELLVQRIYGYVAYVVGDGPDAEDITSETIERAIRYRRRYNPGRGTPTAWVLGIARTRIAEHFGGLAPLAVETSDELPEAVEPELALVDRIAVRAAVARLAVRDRELIALRYGADLTARQIGRLLGMRTNAVEVALHRAQARLQRELAGDFAPGLTATDAP